MLLKGYSTISKLQNWSLTIRSSLVSYPEDSKSSFSQRNWPLATPFQHLEVKAGLSICLPQEQFEEYNRDYHIDVRAWHDPPIDRIGSLQLLSSPLRTTIYLWQKNEMKNKLLSKERKRKILKNWECKMKFKWDEIHSICVH